jgi:hypothetical protein
MTFRVNDRVEMNHRYGSMVGRRGTVVYADTTIVRVSWDQGSTVPVNKLALQHVSVVDALAGIVKEDE